MIAPTPTTIALGLACAGAGLVATTGQGTWRGALAGLAIAFVAILGLGPGALLPLGIFVLGSGALTRIGRARKEAAGAAEAHRGRRGIANVAAKLGLPAFLGAVGLLVDPASGAMELVRLMYAAALAAAFADTAATEVGPIARGPVWALHGLRPKRVEHGTPGGVSQAGALTSVAAAALVGWAASRSDLILPSQWPLTAAAGVVATWVESALAGTALGRSLGHHGRNACLSAVAVSLGGVAWIAMGGHR
ncbi:MAG TPA: DUF92 domain-containing protein [Candidatus Eisenbacteria bacterium]|nr:DUF92 domain-containing protein [Candidatus Eisenbacteria bacterium]